MQNGDLMRHLHKEQRSIRMSAIMIRDNFGATINYSETRGHVLTPFLTCVKEGDIVKERLAI